MDNKENIEKMIEEALNSLDGAGRAIPKPFLLTRINARLNKENESSWERAGRFIARPVVVIAGLCLIIAVNALVVSTNRSTADDTTNIADQQSSNTDDFSTTVATLYEIENTEP